MHVDVRLAVVAGLIILAVCLAIGFARNALAIRRDHDARFRRIRQKLEEAATTIIDGLLRKD